MRKRFRSIFLYITVIWIFLFVGYFGIHKFVAEINRVPSESMMATIQTGDFVLVNKIAYGPLIPTEIAGMPFLNLLSGISFVQHAWKRWAEEKERFPGYGEIRHGDMVVFSNEEFPVKKLIKRVVAIPYDTLEIIDGDVCINGIPRIEEEGVLKEEKGVPRPFCRFPEGTGWTQTNYGPLVIPRDCYFVLGDNRGNSQDSRYYGFIHRSHIIGKGIVLTWFRKFSSGETEQIKE